MPLNPTDLAALSRLLDEALDLEPTAVDRWLAELPTEHEHLRGKLAKMLEAHCALSNADFMAAGPKFRAAEEATDETVAHVGELVGPYRLIREIGRGGMGAVWLAERADGTLKRRIALKLPRLAWGAGLAERMARERDIGALLEHPNIARLYDAGVDARGRPYLALEYIDGQPIDEWCLSRSLSVPDRLQLFLQVALAVAYAHGRLVVHRDIKPSNVLVAQDGSVHLLDFGIAKLLDESSAASNLTRDQGRVLSPRHASPEQVAGETITIASDVYSLGVLLFELLTGQSPYESGRNSVAAIEEAILEGERQPASTKAPDKATARLLRGEIDHIVGKALNREPDRRFPTVDAFAQDVERYLAGERVMAQPDSVGYRVRKVLRRHRVGVAAATAVLVAVAAGLVVAVVQSRRADGEAARARIVKEFVVEVFRINQPNSPGNRDLRQAPAEMLLEHGAKLIETKFPGQPRLQAELYGVVGGIYSDMGASYAASQYAARQVKALAALGAGESEQATAVLLLTQTLVAQGRFSDALAQARAAVSLSSTDAELRQSALVWLARVQFELGHYREVGFVLADVDKGRAESATVSAAQARAEGLRAELLCKADRADEALTVFRLAVEKAVKAEGIHSAAAIDIRLAATHYLLPLSRVAESRTFSEPALAALHESGATGSIRAALEEARLARSTYRVDGMTYKQARETFERLRSEVSGFGPSVPQSLAATIDFEYGSSMLLWGDLQNADALLAASAAILRPTVESPARIGTMDMYLGHSAMYLGRNRQAEPLFLENLEAKRFEREARNPQIYSSFIYPAFNLNMQGRFEEARAMLASAPDFGTDEKATVWGRASEEIRSAYARIELDSGRPSQALALMPPEQHDQTDQVLMFSDQVQLRGEILCALGQRARGLELMAKAIARVAATDINPDDSEVARARAAQGLCALADGQRAKAEQLAWLSRNALQTQPRLTAYLTQPSRQLDALLADSATGNRAVGRTAHPDR